MKNNIKYNQEFKILDTEEKAYLIGYFYGDGWINTQKQTKRNKLYINYRCCILSKDEEIIDKIKYNFPFFNKTTFCKKYYNLSIYNKNLFEDLQKIGVFERKSSENKELLKIPNMSPELIPHFIRGLYDSDGGFYLYGSLLETFFCSTSFNLISEVKSWFLTQNIKVNILKKERKDCLPIYHMRTKSNKSALLFYNLIYKNAKIFMLRKKEVFEKALMLDPAIKKSIYNSNIKGTKKQFEKLHRDYPLYIEKYKDIENIEFPSVCCNYHTIKTGYTNKKGIKKPTYLCLKCGKKSVYNKVLLKQDELTGTS